MVATFLVTCLTVVLQLSRYSVFHSGDTSFDSVFYDRVTPVCYELRSLELDNRTTLVLSNTRELDRVPSTE